MKDGFLIINKPQEMTSFDVVAIMRKKLGIKRIGHLGTLDPMATGVLPIAIGKATKVMEYLEGDFKEYLGEFTFGITTDTEDIWGEILSETDASFVDEDSIKNALEDFRGVIDQVPPIYSALKVDGKKLYQYARAGEEIEIKSRKIYIDGIEFLGFTGEPEQASKKVGLFKIRCSKGTYIRSLARDLGKALGCGCAMSGLTRTKVGSFGIQDSITVDDIKALDLDGIGIKAFPVDSVLKGFPAVHLGDWEAKLFSNGVPLRDNQWREADAATASFDEFPLPLPEEYANLYRVYGSADTFFGMGIKLPDGGLKAHKVFAERE